MAFADLTWEELKEWAGSRVVARGKSYRCAVEDLRLTADGRLLAWVQGGDRYATLVSISKAGKLSSACTCPYASACKHAVAMEFFDRPGVDRYAEVQKATATLGLWDTVRPMLLRWLETGLRPDQAPAAEPPRRGGTKGAPQEATRKSAWPLPSTGLLVPGEKGRHRSFPDTTTLIAIAIQEKRNDDVLRWYKQAGKRGGYWQDHHVETVAEAVQETHPDEALAIWLRTAKAQIAMTKPAAYQMAGASLTKMKAVYQRTGRLPEWERLLVTLRTENARKPRMIEVLDGLEGKRARILKP